MKLASMKNAVTRGVGRQILAAKKHSPHIFFAVGVAGVVGGAVLACKATLKLPETLDELQREVDKAKDAQKELNPDQHQRDMLYVYGKGTLKIARLYGPSIVVGSASIALLTGSHVQLTRRNSALMAAYTGLHSAFEKYRNRVREAVGEEKEKELYMGAHTEAVIDGKISKQVKVLDPNSATVYMRCFDEANPNWQKNAEMNLLFLKCHQEWANHKLQARGYLFLNEVYRELGFDDSEAGQVVGWRIGGAVSDNYVDFGFYEAHASEFINGTEPRIWLDFNVDGVIFDVFKEKD